MTPTEEAIARALHAKLEEFSVLRGEMPRTWDEALDEDREVCLELARTAISAMPQSDTDRIRNAPRAWVRVHGPNQFAIISGMDNCTKEEADEFAACYGIEIARIALVELKEEEVK